MEYRREIDGLRALAVLPVIMFHAGFEAFSGGFVGVDVFFVISGYLITGIILKELEQGKYSIVNFYERRARRILPALFLVMFVCISFAWLWLLPKDMKDFSQSLVAVSVFASNILFWHESGYFDTAAELKPLLHTWSLAVEEQYYVLFPLILLLSWRVGRRWMLILLTIVGIASFCMAQWASSVRPAAAFFLLPTRGWEFLIGAFTAMYLSKDNCTEFSRGASEVGGWLGLALIFYSVFTYNKATPFPGLYALVPTIGTALIILFVTQNTTVCKFVGNRFFVSIGLVSYSAYLWHQPLFAFARQRSLSEPSDFVFIVLSTVTLVLAYLSWHFVESPFRDKGRIVRSKLFVFVVIGSLFFSALGLYGYAKEGYLGRYPFEVMQYFQLKTQSDEYVWDLKDKLRGVDFDPSKVKILLIGDSNSGDILNSLATTSAARNISFSTLTINNGCGNLFLPKKKFEHLIDTERVKICASADDLMLEKNRLLISQADWVFIASSWSDWESELFSDSYNKLLTEFGNKFWIVGDKRLDFSPEKHIRFHGNASFPKVVQRDISKDLINKKLKSIVDGRFIDPYDLLCDDNGCAMVSANGDLIQYDGFHLTNFGAQYFGKKLESYLSNRIFFGSDSLYRNRPITVFYTHRSFQE